MESNTSVQSGGPSSQSTRGPPISSASPRAGYSKGASQVTDSSATTASDCLDRMQRILNLLSPNDLRMMTAIRLPEMMSTPSSAPSSISKNVAELAESVPKRSKEWSVFGPPLSEVTYPVCLSLRLRIGSVQHKCEAKNENDCQ